ncbi:MAG: hypothetical protein HY774_04645 [Acidobacteria bacterium]|nr:hypothetical protein [Acidobacteriota bacterium]
MTHEEMERTMGFILTQQAKFSVDIDLLKESQERLTENQARMSADIGRLTENQASMAANQASMSADIASLIELSRRSMETADADRRLVREMVQDLKEMVYRVESKADDALRLARRSDSPSSGSE